MKRTLFSVSAAVLLLGANPQVSWADARVESNVVYGMYSGLALLMDVHYPAEPNGYGIVFIPTNRFHTPLGFDWEPTKQRADREILGAEELLAGGYTLFSINYRSAPRFRYPAALEDAQRAVRFVRHNAPDFGIDADRIGAWGSGSGGYLALLLGGLDGDGNPQDASPVNHESARVQTVAAFWPTTDFTALAQGTEGDKTYMVSFLGMRIAGNPQSEEARFYAEASPISYVSPDDPPVLLVHGDRDIIAPFSQSERFHETLVNSGVPASLIRMPGAGHGTQITTGEHPPEFYLGPTVEWFDRHLRHRP